MAEVTKYICPGSCEGTASEYEWAAGQQTCQEVGCERYGKKLIKRRVCEICGRPPSGTKEHICEVK